MNHSYIVLLLGILSMTVFHTAAQPLAMCNIKNTDGMNGENVNRIFKDSRGIVWIGTNRGLVCYNGLSVVNLRMSPTAYTVPVNDIAETTDGRIVTATDQGLFAVDLPSMSCQQICPDVKSASSLCVLRGQLYAGTTAGLCVYQDDQHVNLFHPEANVMADGNAVQDICIDDSLHLWLCAGQQIFRYDTRSRHLQAVSLKDYIHAGTATCIAKSGPYVFVGTSNNGLLRYDTVSKTVQPYSVVPVNYVRDLNTDGSHTLYISGNQPYAVDTRCDSILAVYGKQHSQDTGLDLPSDGAYTFWHDDALDINWFGFFLEGMSYNYHVRRLLHTYTFRDLDTSRLQVRSFCIHGHDILIGTRHGFYHINEQQGLIRYFAPDELEANVVTDIVWFAGRFALTTFEHGMRIYDPTTQKLVVPQGDSGLVEGNFSCMAVTPDGQRLFAAGNLGLFAFDSTWHYVRNYNYQNSKLPNAYISSVYFDRQGKGWISTMQGLCLYDPHTSLIMSQGFPDGFFHHERLLAFSPAPDGDILAFADHCIYKTSIDLGSFEKYDLADRLDLGGINFVYPIGPDYLVGTNTGLFLFDRQFRQFRQYTESDNLPSLSFNKQEIQQTADGNLWMANSKGLIYMTVHDRSHLKDSIPGKVMLARLIIDGRSQPFGTLLQNQTEAGHSQQIRLWWNFGCEKITFSPTLLNYAKRTGCYYEYTVDGGEAWLTVRETDEANICSLGVGHHQLSVRLAGHSETTTTYHLSVVPSWLFYFEAAFIILLFTAAWALHRLHRRTLSHRNLLRQKHRLEQELSAQTAVRLLLRQQQQERQAYQQEQEEARLQRTAGREYKELCRQVKEYMELKRPYRNAKFRLSDLAKAVDSSPTMISLMLNQNMDTNFYDFVNRYRLEEYKRRSQDEHYRHLSMIALAEMCGFKKTTFFNAFKKFEGCTPGEWADKHENTPAAHSTQHSGSKSPGAVRPESQSRSTRVSPP